MSPLEFARYEVRGGRQRPKTTDSEGKSLAYSNARWLVGAGAGDAGDVLESLCAPNATDHCRPRGTRG